MSSLPSNNDFISSDEKKSEVSMKRKADELENDEPDKTVVTKKLKIENTKPIEDESSPKVENTKPTEDESSPKVDKYGFKLNELTQIDWHGKVPTDCKLCMLFQATHVWHLCCETQDHHIQTCRICHKMFKDNEAFLSTMKKCPF